MKIETACRYCGKAFSTTTARQAAGRGLYCSQGCRAKAVHTGRPKPKSAENWKKAVEKLRGRPAWNHGEQVSKPCERCGTVFSGPPSAMADRRFCSLECDWEWRRSRRGTDHPLYKEKVRKVCKMCGKVVYVKPSLAERFGFCSRRCTGAYVSTLWPRTSSIEMLLREELTRRGIAFAPEYPVGQFAIDIAIPEHRIAIEADGTYWHSRPEQKPKDKRRDTFLRNRAWTVFRFPEPRIRSDVRGCVDEVEKHIASQLLERTHECS